MISDFDPTKPGPIEKYIWLLRKFFSSFVFAYGTLVSLRANKLKLCPLPYENSWPKAHWGQAELRNC